MDPQGVAEGTNRQSLDFDSLYGKAFKITDNNGDPKNPGFSIVTPLNGSSWHWKERPEFKEIVKQKLNDPGFLGDHKYQQIIDAISGNKFNTKKHVMKGVTEGKSNTIPKIGINVRNDKDIDYASLIVDGKKKYESRKTDSLRPYVGKTVGIVRTGNGPAVAIGQVTIGEPIVVNAEKFDLLRKKHLVPKGSKFDIDNDDTKYLYPMINPVRWENEKSIKHKGIVSRKIQESMAYINQSNEGGNLEGYVIDSDKPQLTNYLSSQGADNNLINQLKQKYKTIAIIRNMYVDEEQRGQGYGNQLMSDAIDEAAGNHADAIICVADMSEDNAIDLVKWYENFGFEVVGKAGSDPVMVLEL
jgi:GNAT superfamily N-acetyltransferase/predicted transcriptional regulator